MDVHQFEPLWGNWYIRDIIGSGSYGVVYLAERKMPDNSVEKAAIKHISIPKDEAELQNIKNNLRLSAASDINGHLDNLRNDILNEYKNLQLFSGSRNFVQVHDILYVPKEDIPGYDIFIRMELLHGIDTRINPKKPDEKEVVRLGKDICTALIELHKKNLVHRDIKPQNILVSDDGIYKLADFGSVHKMTGTSSAMSMKGTWCYTAPEIFLGSEADSRIDIYSLGIVMYQLLSKHVPPEIRVPGIELDALPPNISPRLASVVMKACEYYPDKRWHSAEEMLNAFSIPEDPLSPPPPAHHSRILVVVSCIVLFSILALYFSGILRFHPDNTDDNTITNRASESTQQATISEKEAEAKNESSDTLYTVTWQDDTGNVIGTDKYAYGSVPSHSVPTKESDNQYTYTFSGWSPNIEKVTADTMYKATYSSVTNKYTITWQDDTGKTIASDEYAYGAVPEHSDPVKKADAQYSYTFSGWSPNIEKVTSDIVYRATFVPTINNYTITWLDDTGAIIATDTWAYGTVPNHSNPTKSADRQFTYSFNGWSPAVASVTSDAVYKATFVSTTNNYTITWQDDTGAIIATDTWAYGTIPSHSSPTKRSDGQYTYTFSRWTPSVDIVTGNTTYKAVYNKEPIPTPTPAPAAASWPIGRSFTVIANNNNKNRIYNLRSGPGTDYPKIGDIKQGESYKILDCQHGNTDYDWLKFQKGGTEYWINSGVVDVDGHGFGIINGEPRF